jgi:2-oxoglutarate ferredoxin oxidoreductase subunit gamma
VEREVLLTGIGGQGIQLAGTALAAAAANEGREVMVFGSYGASMRGANSDVTVVLGTERLTSPPTVSRAWAALVMHHGFWPGVRDRLRPGSTVVLDLSVFKGPIGRDDLEVVALPFSTMAIDLGTSQACGMVALGALSAATGLVELAALEAVMAQILPPYRAQHAAGNVVALRAGHAAVPRPTATAWAVPSKTGLTTTGASG